MVKFIEEILDPAQFPLLGLGGLMRVDIGLGVGGGGEVLRGMANVVDGGDPS